MLHGGSEVIHASFSDRVQCFYCDGELTREERASGDLCCRSCFRKLTAGKPRSRRKILDIYEIECDFSRPAYRVIPVASYLALKASGRISFKKTSRRTPLTDVGIARRILNDHTLEVYVTVSSEAEERREAAKSTK